VVTACHLRAILTGVGLQFRHEALFYAGSGDFLDGTVPFIREGVAAGEPVLVAVPAARVGLLRSALGADAAAVRFADMEELGRNPARIIPAWQEFVDVHGGAGRPLRGIGEPIWSGRTEPEIDECVRHESLLNLAFDDGPGWQLLCPYDTDRLADEVLAHARRTHPSVVEDGLTEACGEYLAPCHAPGPFEGRLDAVPPGSAVMPFERAQLGAVRLFTEIWAIDAGLGPGRVTDLVLAVNELAANSIRHGGGAGTARAWRSDGSLVFQIEDRGRVTHPLAGRLRPGYDYPDGRGLWIANQVCDLVQIRSGEDGTTVRIRMALA
jgi:anti-sigma regulatory factor (Ser/Thr protein kinase)